MEATMFAVIRQVEVAQATAFLMAEGQIVGQQVNTMLAIHFDIVEVTA